jgi:hypothetical protein
LRSGLGLRQCRRGKHCCQKKRDHKFHLLILSIQFVYLAHSPIKITTVLFMSKKIYSETKSFMKKLLASVNNSSRFSGDNVIRTLVNTPAMLGNNN